MPPYEFHFFSLLGEGTFAPPPLALVCGHPCPNPLASGEGLAAPLPTLLWGDLFFFLREAFFGLEYAENAFADVLFPICLNSLKILFKLHQFNKVS